MKELLSDPDASFASSLRGIPVLVMDRDDGTLIWARVYENTGTQLKLDVPLSRSPDRYDAYILGSVPVAIESVDLTFNAPQERKSVTAVIIDYERGSGGKLAFYMAADSKSPTKTNWSFIGYVPLTGAGRYILPVEDEAASGYVLRYLIMGMDPAHLFSITHIALEYDMEATFT